MNYLKIFAIAAATLMLTAPAARAATVPNLKVGVAKVDITPKDTTDMVGISPRPYGGVHDRLYARALVLDNGTVTAAIVALDLVEMGDTTVLRQRIEKELGIPAAHIIIDASHDHNAPRGGPPTAGTSSADGRPYSPPAYIQQVDDSIVDVLKQAKAAVQPALVGYGTGKVDVSVARYGYTPERGWRENPNEDIPVDKTVRVAKFTKPDGTPIAIMFNYAVHSNAETGEPSNMINGDIAGNAETFIEHQYKDQVVALWSMSAAADVYPKFNWDMGLETDSTDVFAPIEIQGAMIGGEVMKVIKRTTDMTGVVTLYADARAVPCEMNIPPASGRVGPSSGNGGANGGNGGNAGGNGAGQNGGNGGGQNAAAGGPPRPAQMKMPHLLDAPKPGDTLDIQLGFIRINQLAITGVSGEIGSHIFEHVASLSPFPENMMITLSNNRDGYIPDDAGWDHQGQGQAFVRGCAEKAIVNNLVEMMKASLQ
jgi:hypothetical protein